MTLHWRGLGAVQNDPESSSQGGPPVVAAEEAEGYQGDASESSGDERTILPMQMQIAGVVMPTPRADAFSYEDLIARGGQPVSTSASRSPARDADDDWLLSN